MTPVTTAWRLARALALAAGLAGPAAAFAPCCRKQGCVPVGHPTFGFFPTAWRPFPPLPGACPAPPLPAPAAGVVPPAAPAALPPAVRPAALVSGYHPTAPVPPPADLPKSEQPAESPPAEKP